MLCLGFVFLLFALHALKTKQNSSEYRILKTHQKVQHCLSILHICAVPLLIFFSPHYILKHLAVLQPKKSDILLWLLPESHGFNMLLACKMVSPELAVLTSMTYPLTLSETFILLNGVWKLTLF